MEPLELPEDLHSVQADQSSGHDPRALELPEGAFEPAPPPPQAKPYAPDPWRPAKIAASEFVKGLPTIPGLPGDLSYMLELAGSKLWGQEPRKPGEIFGTGEFWREPLRELGAIDRPELQPRDAGEAYLGATARGVGAMGPLAAMAPGLAALPLLLGGAGSGAGGEAAKRNVNTNWFEQELGIPPEYTQAGAEFLGAVAGGVPASMLGNVGARAISAMTGPKAPAIARYENAGVTPRLAGDVTQSPGAMRVQEGVRNTPTGAATIARAQGQMADEFEASVAGMVDRLGGAASADEAGTLIQHAANRWMKDWSQKSKDAWNLVNTKIGKDTPVAGNATGAKLNQILDEMTDAPESVKAVMPDIRAWQQRLSSDSAATGGTLRYETVKNIRSKVGEYIDPRAHAGDKAQGWLKQLYGALTDDMKATAQSVGALDDFNAANAITREGHAFVKRVINPVLGPKDKPLEPGKAYDWFKALERAGAKRIERTKSMMTPDEAESVAGFRLRQAAAPKPGSATGREVSPGSFLTEKNKISPEALEKYFPDPAMRQKLADLGYVAERSRNTFQQAGNPSGTAKNVQMGALFAGAPAAMAAGTAAGMPAQTAAALALSLGVPYAVAKAVSSPTVARILATPGAYGARAGAQHLVPAAGGLSALLEGGR